MNRVLDSIFKYRKPNYHQLENYGFKKFNGAYRIKTEIMGGQFALHIVIDNADIDTQVIDLETNEPYTLFLAEGVSGSFVGAVRAEYEKTLLDIADKCFEKCVFKSEYAQKLIQYVSDAYGDALEFLWEKFPDNAIWRRKDNKKWYGALLTITKNKIGLPSQEKIEIIDLRADPENIDSIVDNVTIFKGYHMNKKHWITICLDGTVALDDIKKILDASYELAGGK